MLDADEVVAGDRPIDPLRSVPDAGLRVFAGVLVVLGLDPLVHLDSPLQAVRVLHLNPKHSIFDGPVIPCLAVASHEQVLVFIEGLVC